MQLISHSRRYAAALIAGASLLYFQPAISASTGMIFAGGCPESAGGLCAGGSNATEANVAAILGVAEADVTQINSGFSAGVIGDQSGTWSVTDTSITHLAFKSDGYFILGEITAASGAWDNDTTAIGGWDITLVDCTAAICGAIRAYVDLDFLTNGGQIAGLSNVRAFSVVPVPAAAWMFGGALALLGWIRRKSI